MQSYDRIHSAHASNRIRHDINSNKKSLGAECMNTRSTNLRSVFTKLILRRKLMVANKRKERIVVIIIIISFL